MTTKTIIIIAVVVAGCLVGSAILVRNGLESIAAAIRDKPLPQMPEKVSVQELTVQHATVESPNGTTATTPRLNITIENMRLEALTAPSQFKSDAGQEEAPDQLPP